MDGPVVVGTDGSDSALLAVREAIAIAAAAGRPLHVVSAYKPFLGSGAPGHEFDGQIGPLTQVEAILADAGALARMSGVTAEVHAVKGDPADALCTIAETTAATMLVVGNKGLNSVKRFVLGSVPSKVVHNAPCSTYIVHTA